jgi:hypothetical protein
MSHHHDVSGPTSAFSGRAARAPRAADGAPMLAALVLLASATAVAWAAWKGLSPLRLYFPGAPKEVGVALVAAAATVFVSTLTVVVGRYFERKRELDALYPTACSTGSMDRRSSCSLSLICIAIRPCGRSEVRAAKANSGCRPRRAPSAWLGPKTRLRPPRLLWSVSQIRGRLRTSNARSWRARQSTFLSAICLHPAIPSARPTELFSNTRASTGGRRSLAAWS